ncbi:MAG: hypothetical protein JWM99_4862 [Verrucomicrobiales bacterium]|nr:hypothetical protein [Verrucomicrobiales bacterium]
MPDSDNSAELVSEAELVKLSELLRDFEGASDPRSQKCREANAQFNTLVSNIYFERINPRTEFKEWTSSQFYSVVRNECRARLDNSGPRFLCP